MSDSKEIKEASCGGKGCACGGQPAPACGQHRVTCSPCLIIWGLVVLMLVVSLIFRS